MPCRMFNLLQFNIASWLILSDSFGKQKMPNWIFHFLEFFFFTNKTLFFNYTNLVSFSDHSFNKFGIIFKTKEKQLGKFKCPNLINLATFFVQNHKESFLCPNSTLFRRVHSGTNWAFEYFAEQIRVHHHAINSEMEKKIKFIIMPSTLKWKKVKRL